MCDSEAGQACCLCIEMASADTLGGIVLPVLCHATCQRPPRSPIQPADNNPSFIWRCRTVGLDLQADVCRGLLKRPLSLSIESGLRDALCDGPYCEWSGAYGKLQQCHRRGPLRGTPASTELNLCAADPITCSWLKNGRYGCEIGPLSLTKWFDGVSFPAFTGPPYGWEEAYTADGVKYYIK